MTSGLLVGLLATLLGAEEAPPAYAGWTAPMQVTGTLDGVSATHDLIVYLPRGYAEHDQARRWPLVIALHGWKHSAAMMRERGGLEALADRYGIVVSVPDMGTTVYERALYPESRRAWSRVPGLRWIGEVILPYLRQHFAVTTERARTAIIGYSTGGRGAVLAAAAYPEFAFAGSVSGTFDLMRLSPREGEYRIHAAVFGARDRFPERWRREDVLSPDNLAGLRDVRLYAAHGEIDKSVKSDQLRALQEALAGREHVEATFELTPRAAHDWAYWRTQWAPIFAALDRTFSRGQARDDRPH